MQNSIKRNRIKIKDKDKINEEVQPPKPFQHWNVEKLGVSQGIESLHYSSELSSGFKEDCEEFLLEFATKESYTYRSFADTWRNLQFQQILQGEDNTEYLVTFLDNCFFQLKKYIVFSTNVYIQVGAFYMLYSIYHKQPERDLVKIRWTLDEYTAVLKLVEHVQNQSDDFIYIFTKMKQSSAFLFVAETRRWGIEPKYSYEEKHLVDNIFGHDINFARVKAKIFSDDFYGLHHIQDVYKEYQEGLKKYLTEHPEHKASSAFQTTTLTQDLKKKCEEFELKPTKQEKAIAEAAIISKRRAIKNKAYRMKTRKFWESTTNNE